MSGAQRLESWELAVDERDELIIVGTTGGKSDGGLLAETAHGDPGFVRLRDGRWLKLGTPHPRVAHDPWAMPAGYNERRLSRLTSILARLRAGEGPSEQELAAAPLLEAWFLEQAGEAVVVLRGYVTGHPRLADGDFVRTSPVVWLDESRGAARTVSRWYRLGESLEHALQLRLKN